MSLSITSGNVFSSQFPTFQTLNHIAIPRNQTRGTSKTQKTKDKTIT